MTQRPPPLQWLPAFEAAARHTSFSRAAEELHITTSAVSQQVRQLEAYLGQALFARHGRRVALTVEGQAYAHLAAEVLSTYRRGHEQLMARRGRAVIHLSMTPLVAHELVLPALADFQRVHPDIDLRIEASMALSPLNEGGRRAAIRYGDGRWPGLLSQALGASWATLVASPQLAARCPVIEVADLAQHTLIHQRAGASDWALAAHLLGVGEVPRRADLVLDSNLSAVRAAEQGLGVAIGVWPLVQPALDEGRLVALWPWMPLDTGDYFVRRLDDPHPSEMARVYDWLQALFKAPMKKPAHHQDGGAG